MATLRFAGMLLFGALCLALAAFAATRGDLAALGLSGFGVACIAGGFLMREPQAPEEPLRTGTVTSHGRTFSGLVVTFSRRRSVLAVVAAVGFVAGGIWITLEEHLLLGLLCTALFAVMTVAGLYGVVRGAGVLVLTEQEIVHVSAAGRASVRWDDVTSAHRYDIRGTPFLRIESPAGAELAGGLPQALAALSRRDDLEIPLGAVGVDPDWLEALVERCVDDPAERARVAAGDVRA